MSAFMSFVGRLLLASLFLLSGALKLSAHDPLNGGPVVAYMTPKTDEFLEKVHSWTGFQVELQKDHYQYLVLTAAALELVGGVLFVLNVKFGAVLLVAFIIPTTIIMHNFWDMEEGTGAQQVEFVNFFKNVCLLGAFIMYVSDPAARPTIKQKAL